MALGLGKRLVPWDRGDHLQATSRTKHAGLYGPSTIRADSRMPRDGLVHGEARTEPESRTVFTLLPLHHRIIEDRILVDLQAQGERQARHGIRVNGEHGLATPGQG